MGELYYGYTTWAAAVSRHPNLKCIAPANINVDVCSSAYRQGALDLQLMGDWTILMDSRTYQNALRLDHWHLPLIAMDDVAGIPSSDDAAVDPARAKTSPGRRQVGPRQAAKLNRCELGTWAWC